MKTFVIALVGMLFLGMAAPTQAYFRSGRYTVEISGDSAAVNRSGYIHSKRSNVYRQMGDGRIVNENLLKAPSWYMVVPAPKGTVDVFYVEAGQRKHMRARMDLWERYGWDCRFHIGEQGPVQFGGKTWY